MLVYQKNYEKYGKNYSLGLVYRLKQRKYLFELK